MATTTTHHTPHSGCPCPSRDELGALVSGDTPTDRQAELTEHVGDCPGCQKAIEAIATAGDPALSDVVKHIDRADPPSDSAFWKAVGEAEFAVTREFDGGGSAPRGELKLDFLQPTETPGRIGRISQFDVLRVIGRGGMGVVLHGFDPDLHRDVAIKILDPQLANNDLAQQRFCREARAAAAVSHDNLVGVFLVADDESSGLPFLVMQLVNGESLEQRLRRVGKLPVAEAVRVGMQAAAGLAAAHAAGLIHRDIKPGNILIEAGADKVKLTDFGLARATEDMKLTRTGFVAGTPLYMAPEQARGDEIDARADLFSLGSVLYEALTGKPPFQGKTPLAVLRQVADEDHESVRRLNPEVPDWLEEIIDRLLAKDPKDRIQTAAEVSEQLACGLAKLGSLSPLEVPAAACPLMIATGASRLTRKRGRHFCIKTAAMIATVFLAGLVVGGGLVWELTGRRSPTAPVPPEPGLPPTPPGVAPAEPMPPPGPPPKGMVPVKSGAVWAVGLSPNGSTLVVGSENGRVSLWTVADGRVQFDLHADADGEAPAHRGTVWAAEFTADGSKIMTAGDDGYVRVWDAETGKPTKALPVGVPVRAAAVSPDGSYVVVGDRLGQVKVWDLHQDRPILTHEHKRTVNAVAFSPDGLTVASAGADGTVILWEIPANRQRFRLTGHTGPVYSVAFAPDGDRLVTASWDQTAVVWDLTTGTQVKQFTAHEDGAWAVAYAPCGKIIATGGQDGQTMLWDPETGAVLQTFGRQKGTIHAVRFSKDGHSLAAGGQDGNVRVWAVECKTRKEEK